MKKIAAILLSVLLAAVLFAGCDDMGGTGTTSTTRQTTALPDTTPEVTTVVTLPETTVEITSE